MKLELSDFTKRDINPQENYIPISATGDETLENALLDPALLASLTGGGTGLKRELTRMATADVLRQQQFLIYSMASRVGVLEPFVSATKKALQAFDFDANSLDAARIAASILKTNLGIATDVLAAVPVYGQIAAAVLEFAFKLAFIADNMLEKAKLVTPLLPMQAYSPATDQDVFNIQVLRLTRGDVDWTTIFMPRYNTRGELTGETRENRVGQLSIGWALGNGVLPRANFHDLHRKDQRKSKWSIGQGEFEAATDSAGQAGLGFIPGGERIYGIVQTTALYDQLGPSRAYTSVYNKRCAGIEQVDRADTGALYPTTTQGVLSLWDFMIQRNPAMFTIDPQGLYDGRSSTGVQGWRTYFNKIWEGVLRAWRNPEWEGGWGCSFWEAALMQLVTNYTVGYNGVIGWTGAFSPGRPRPDRTGDAVHGPIDSKDQDRWDNENVFTKIIEPTLRNLLSAQMHYLSTTTMAAYLPIYGGVDADPLRQDLIMGSMREPIVAKMFVQGRRQILDGPLKYDVRLVDVVDREFRRQIRNAGGGTTGRGMPVISARPPLVITARPPTGGSGWAPTPDSEWTPPGGFGLVPQPSQPSKWRQAAPYLIGGGTAVAATAAGYYFWDDLAALLRRARRRLPGRS